MKLLSTRKIKLVGNATSQFLSFRSAFRNQDWPDGGAIKRVIHKPNDPVSVKREPSSPAAGAPQEDRWKQDPMVRGGGDAKDQNLVARIIKENNEAAAARDAADRLDISAS